MWVGTVSQSELLSSFDEGSLFSFGSSGDSIGGSVLSSEVVGDGRIVSGSVREGLFREISHVSRRRQGRKYLDSHSSFEIFGNGTVSSFPESQELVVILGIREDDDSLVILSRSSKKGNSSNVYLLHRFGDRGSRDLGDSLVERVEVADDDSDGRDLLSVEISEVGWNISSENS